MENLIVPVYLNQRMVFDLLAMLQGGISTVTAVTRVEAHNNSDSEEIRASFGLSQALSSLLKIDLSGEKSKNRSSSGESKVTEERVHTPASLFYELRNMLLEKELLKNLTAEVNLEPGDIIEFEASLKINPIIETMDSLSEIMNVALVFEDKEKKIKNKKVNYNNQSTDNKKVKNQIDAFRETLKTGNTIDLIAKELKTNYYAVITIESNYLNDPTMSDLVDGQFKILGKIIRNIKDNNTSISLIRKTALHKMPPYLLTNVLNAISQLGSEQGFAIPELVWEIKGPAIHILPLSIFA